MNKRNPYNIIKSRYVTEKAKVLESLKDASSNPSLKKCEAPKYVFLVDKNANKVEIAGALEEIYSNNKIKVVKVNTVNMKSKIKRVKGRLGKTAAFKKAIVTLEKGNIIEENI